MRRRLYDLRSFIHASGLAARREARPATWKMSGVGIKPACPLMTDGMPKCVPNQPPINGPGSMAKATLNASGGFQPLGGIRIGEEPALAQAFLFTGRDPKLANIIAWLTRWEVLRSPRSRLSAVTPLPLTSSIL